MYAIVDIAGQQFKVEKEQKIFVHRLEAEQGQKLEFDKVLLIDNDGKVNVGAPVIEGAKVTAEVISHLKGDKVKVFKRFTTAITAIVALKEKRLMSLLKVMGLSPERWGLIPSYRIWRKYRMATLI